ncbi:MAG: hypothetical protein U0074_02700 [Kouleothrix sp.]
MDTALVRIDLKAAQLHLLAGYPGTDSDGKARAPWPDLAADQRNSMLLAAFNGGFWRQPMARLVWVWVTRCCSHRDGWRRWRFIATDVQLGSWGTDIMASPNIVARAKTAHCCLLVATHRRHGSFLMTLSWPYGGQ